MSSQCTQAEADRAACLNGGTCYVEVGAGGSRVPVCKCTPDWTGDRCEAVFVDPDLLESSSASAMTIGIAVGLTLAVLTVVVLLVVFLLIKKRKARKAKRRQSETSHVTVVDGAVPNGRTYKVPISNTSLSIDTQHTTISYLQNTYSDYKMYHETAV